MKRIKDQMAVKADDASHPGLPPELTMEMSRLYSAGYSLLPLGGDGGKKATVRFEDRNRLPLSRVINRMLGGGSQTYGIRLGGLLVIDVDTDTAEARAYVQANFGSSPVQTRTKRGFHLYFRHVGKKPNDIRLPNVAIEFKSGENSYVVGPCSVRPDDGGQYVAHGRLNSPKNLPWFVDRRTAAVTLDCDGKAPTVGRGFRHKALKKRARELALVADGLHEVADDLKAFRDWEIEEPADFPDKMVEKMAEWFWEKRETGMLWGKTNSGVFVHRHPISLLARQGNALALMVYNVVLATHGHKGGKEFALCPDGLRVSGRVKAGRHQLYAAIHLLVDLGLLTRRAIPIGKRISYRYQIAAPWLAGERAEGSFLTLVSDGGTSMPVIKSQKKVA